jgi:hypothetical protein
MSDHPIPLNEDDLAKVVGGAGGLPSISKDEGMQDMNSIAKLFQEMAQETRNSARETRGAEMSAQIESVKGVADDMRAAAEHRMQAASMAGTTLIAGGAMSLGGAGLKEAHSMSEKSSALGGASQELAGGKTAHLSNDIGHAQTGMVNSIGTLVSASVDHRQTDIEARRLEANSAVHGNAVTQANDIMQQMQNVIKDVRDKLSTIEQSRLETTRGIGRNF